MTDLQAIITVTYHINKDNYETSDLLAIAKMDEEELEPEDFIAMASDVTWTVIPCE